MTTFDEIVSKDNVTKAYLAVVDQFDKKLKSSKYSGIDGKRINDFDIKSEVLIDQCLKELIENNPKAKVITNTSVGKLLDEANIPYIIIEQGQKHYIKNVEITGFGDLHAEIYELYGRVQNTGYTIDNLCYPGDAFHSPDVDVDNVYVGVEFSENVAWIV